MHGASVQGVFTQALPSRATRRISPRSRTSVRTFLPIGVPADGGRPRLIGLESKGEADCLFLTLATGQVHDVWEQAGPVAYEASDGRRRLHTFDFLFTMIDGTRIANAIKPYDQAIAKGFDRELALIARAAIPGFCDKVVLCTDRDYTPEAARDARRYYYATQNPDPEADAALSHLCTDLHGRVQIRALSAQAGHLGGRMFGAVLRAIYAGMLRHMSRGQITPASFVGRVE